MGCASGDGCTYIADADYAGGAGGPNADAANISMCCALCAANADCEVGVYQGHSCFFKTKADAATPMYKEGVIAAWPAGRNVTPPGPPNPACGKVYSYETHGYYLHGDGYRTVNSRDGLLSPFSPNMPPAMVGEAVTGPQCPGTFTSEFGAVAISSFESLSPTLSPPNWGLHNAAMAQVCLGKEAPQPLRPFLLRACFLYYVLGPSFRSPSLAAQLCGRQYYRCDSQYPVASGL